MYCVSKLKGFVPPIWRYKINYLLTKEENVVIPPGKRVFIFLAANYGNLGDIAITYAQHKCLEIIFPSYVVVEVPANCPFSYLKGVLSQVRRHDIITFVGGGNMGDMYPLYENIRQLIVLMFPDNRVIQFPLTADFSSSQEGRMMQKSAKNIYRNHKYLTILSRETKSQNFLSGLLKRKIMVVPDIVMTLNFLHFSVSERKGVSVCLRQDKEKSLSENATSSIDKILRERFPNMDYSDTLIEDASVTLENKEKYLGSYLQSLATKQLLVTDRLHGMIFAYITGTPAIVFSNSNQKVKFCYEWIKDCSYIFFMETYDAIIFSECLSKAQVCHVDRDKFLRRNEMFNKKILNAL